MAWYDGPALLQPARSGRAGRRTALGAFRMPVQQVIREGGARFYAGTIAAGTVRPGDTVVDRARRHAGARWRASRPWTATSTRPEPAGRSRSASPTEVDCSRGDTLAVAGAPPQIADQFEATLIWMAEEPLLPGRQYLLKLGTQTVPATVQEPKYKLGIDTMEQLAARTLALNEIGDAVDPHRPPDRLRAL